MIPALRSFAKRSSLIGVAVVFILAQSGCTSAKKKAERARLAEAERKRHLEPRLVGTITLVNAEGKFVLIDSANRPGPSRGAKLKSRSGAVESAELRVSDIQRPPFTIADIVSGVPQKGDVVYQ